MIILLKWMECLEAKGIHLIPLKVNSLLPKINEIRYIAARTNAAVMGISGSKLDETILLSEIQISYYELLRYDRDRNGGSLACCIRSDIGTNRNAFSRGKWRIILLKFFCLKPNFYLLELSIDLLIKVTFLKL